MFSVDVLWEQNQKRPRLWWRIFTICGAALRSVLKRSTNTETNGLVTKPVYFDLRKGFPAKQKPMNTIPFLAMFRSCLFAWLNINQCAFPLAVGSGTVGPCHILLSTQTNPPPAPWLSGIRASPAIDLAVVAAASVGGRAMLGGHVETDLSNSEQWEQQSHQKKCSSTQKFLRNQTTRFWDGF